MLTTDSAASTIHLKNGQQVDGEIVERQADRIIVKSANGGTAPYWLDEIAKIDESPPASPQPVDSPTPAADQSPAKESPTSTADTPSAAQPGDYAQVQAYLDALGSVMQSVSQAAWSAPNQLTSADPAQMKALAEKMLPLIDQGQATIRELAAPESCRAVHDLSVSILTAQQDGYRALRDGDRAKAATLFLRGFDFQKQLMAEGNRLLQRYEPGQQLFRSAPAVDVALPPVDAKPESPEDQAAADAYAKEYAAIMRPLNEEGRRSLPQIMQALGRKDAATLRTLLQSNLELMRHAHATLSARAAPARYARLHALTLPFLSVSIECYQAMLTGDPTTAEPKMGQLQELARQLVEETLRVDRQYPHAPPLGPAAQGAAAPTE